MNIPTTYITGREKGKKSFKYKVYNKGNLIGETDGANIREVDQEVKNIAFNWASLNGMTGRMLNVYSDKYGISSLGTSRIRVYKEDGRHKLYYFSVTCKKANFDIQFVVEQIPL